MKELRNTSLAIMAFAVIGLILLAYSEAISQTKVFQREQEVFTFKDGKRIVLAFRYSNVSIVDGKRVESNVRTKGKMKTWEEGKRNEWFSDTGTENVEVIVREIDEVPLTVSSKGFTAPEQVVIKQAVESWNTGTVSFVYQPTGGQIVIQRQGLSTAGLSTLNILDGRVVSGVIGIDPGFTNPDALRSVIGHELGHCLQLPDCSKCDSIMTGKTKGRNRSNGFTKPTAADIEMLGRMQ